MLMMFLLLYVLYHYPAVRLAWDQTRDRQGHSSRVPAILSSIHRALQVSDCTICCGYYFYYDDGDDDDGDGVIRCDEI